MRSLSDLLVPFISQPLDDTSLDRLQRYLDLLLKWNAKMNLTAVRDAEQIVQRHFGESIFAGERLTLANASSLIDLGSGAGFPGLPIKIIAPHLQVTLIEAQQKKATFLKEAIRTLELQNIKVHAARAETVSIKSQIVTMRAVEKFEAALPIAASMVEFNGKLGLLIGSAQHEAVRSMLPHFEWQQPIAIPESRSRELLIGLLTGKQANYVPIPAEDFVFWATKTDTEPES